MNLSIKIEKQAENPIKKDSEFTPEFFEAASKAWRENKYSLPNGMFQYVVVPVLSKDNTFPSLFD